MAICKVCGKEFESKRSTALYCSGACRLKHKRELALQDRVSVTDNSPLSVTKPVSVTDNRVSVTGRTGQDGVPGQDVIWLDGYDLSEEGFIRRNANWADWSESTRASIRAGVRRVNQRYIQDRADNVAAREIRLGA